MSEPRTALISGASVAGPTLAHWLAQAGWRVTIVERSLEVRAGGYPIDIRGAAAEVAMRMGIYDDVKAAEQPGRTSHIISPRGRQIAHDLGFRRHREREHRRRRAASRRAGTDPLRVDEGPGGVRLRRLRRDIRPA